MEDSIEKLLGLNPERVDKLINILSNCFEAGITDEEDGFRIIASKCILALENELDITRRESLWIALKLGEACGNKEVGFILHMRNKIGK